ncbi:LacI family DNA-binding transcriptional regulator [Marinobacter sp. Arc7-DN-1]|uniref:LacI family DNA-binding transcriptional regulator n=1 Tax=Marinobacter sp. Arc7-DN-1 TaxID=2304594 RepID=UPI000E438637|nr:LacI family DNA-binding transcriptional regulator [Marinobacter sp. Arc7-DN-1]AXS83124.1 LacI family transcriptional regulator [Marinobacter sp. Arc7-DN-1]
MYTVDIGFIVPAHSPQSAFQSPFGFFALIQKKRVTLRDLAEHLNINTSTVSRALSEKSNGMISPEVVKRVRKAAEEMGYKQNAAAYALKVGSTKTIGMIIPDLMNPVFPPIIRGIQSVLDQYGYTAFLAYSQNNEGVARTEVERLISRGVDGIIYAAAFRKDSVVDLCKKQGVPLVLVNRVVDQGDVDTVKVDDTLGIRMAVDHLLDLGHQKIGFIAGPKDISVSHIRLRAFTQTMSDRDLAVDPHRIVEAHALSETAGEEAMSLFLQKNPDATAVIASNDLIALGCITAMTQFGYTCPKRMSIVGFNNMPYLDWFATPLTTVSIPHFQMGERSADLLLKRIKSGNADFHEEVLLKPRLVVRKSTAAPAKTRKKIEAS